MKLFVAFKLTLLLLVLSGCQIKKAASTPSRTPKKKAEFKREVFDAERYPGLTAVGKLKIEKSWCAMTLVAENIAVTAGHCFIAQEVDLFKLEDQLLRISSVVFKSKDGKQIPNVKVEKILKYKINPDYAIVKLNKKIPKEIIKPLEISDMTFTDMLGNTEKLGCAGYNGDNEFGNRGKNLTISRNIKIYYKESNSRKIDTNCVSTHGGSGGLFFEEKYNEKSKSNEHYLLGIIWGVTGDNFGMNGGRINDNDVVTSITPVKVFREELMDIIKENK